MRHHFRIIAVIYSSITDYEAQSCGEAISVRPNSGLSLLMSSIPRDIPVICDRSRSEFRHMPRPTHIMHRFANPARFLRLSAALRPWALGVALPTLAAGLW